MLVGGGSESRQVVIDIDHRPVSDSAPSPTRPLFFKSGEMG